MNETAKRERQAKINEQMPDKWPVMLLEAQRSLARLMIANSFRSGAALGSLNPKLLANFITMDSDNAARFRELVAESEVEMTKEFGL